jgi:integrase
MVKVKVVRNGAGKGFCVAWRQFAGAPRQRETFMVRAEAIERAEQLAQELSEGLAQGVDFTLPDRESWRHIVLQCDAAKVVPHLIVEEAIAARSVLPEGMTLMEAAKQAAARAKRATLVCPPTADVVTELIASLRSDPYDPPTKGYLSRLEQRLDVVSAAFPRLAELAVDGMDPDEKKRAESRAGQFLLQLKRQDGEAVSAKTRDHFLAAAKMLCGYAQQRSFISAGGHAFSAFKGIAKPGVVETFTLAEMREILKATPEEWLPFVTIGAFAGVRVAEIGRLTWDAIRWEENEIVLAAAITKTGHPRNVPMEPNLRAWLLPLAKRVGRIYPHATESGFENAVGEKLHEYLVKNVEGFQWKDNGLRHSYGSYLYGRERNINYVRACMGNTEKMVMRYYNDPKTEAEGKSYFQIQPAGGAITALPGKQEVVG